VGIWFRFTTDTLLNIDVVEFYDSQQGYEKGLTLPSIPPSGQHSQGVDSVWEMESHHNVVQKQVSTRDFYLNESDWWRLCEKELLLDDIEIEWCNYVNCITYTIYDFIENLNGKYHPNTYAFYGASEKYPSDDHLIWQQIPAPRPVKGVPLELPVYRHAAGNTFELTSSGSTGDGTVPVRAGRINFPGIRSLLATEVDHEGAYAVGDTSTENGLSVAMKFTLRSIIKMAGEVASCG
jgi:hypothetical protein